MFMVLRKKREAIPGVAPGGIEFSGYLTSRSEKHYSDI